MILAEAPRDRTVFAHAQISVTQTGASDAGLRDQWIVFLLMMALIGFLVLTIFWTVFKVSSLQLRRRVFSLSSEQPARTSANCKLFVPICRSLQVCDNSRLTQETSICSDNIKKSMKDLVSS